MTEPTREGRERSPSPDTHGPGAHTYEKPRLRRFSLSAEEVLAKGCKLLGGGASFTGAGCLPGGCFASGS